MQKVLTTQEIVENLVNSSDTLPSEKVELLSCKEDSERIEVVKKIAERWGLSILEHPDNKAKVWKQFKDMIIYGK